MVPLQPSPKAHDMSHKKHCLPALTALATLTALAWPLLAQAAVPAGAAAEIVSLQGTGDQRAAAAADWQPARPAQALAIGQADGEGFLAAQVARQRVRGRRIGRQVEPAQFRNQLLHTRLRCDQGRYSDTGYRAWRPPGPCSRAESKPTRTAPQWRPPISSGIDRSLMTSPVSRK